MTYEGNKHESKVITEVVDTIHARFERLGQNVDNMVFVFDRGNNSKENNPHVKEKFHFIGALKKNQQGHLFGVGLDKFADLYTTEEENLIKGYRTTANIYGKEHTIVVTYNEKTGRKQKKKTDESLQKIRDKFSKLETRINNKKRGKKATTKGIAKQVNNFLHKQYQTLFSWDLDEEKQKFSWHLDEKALQEREKTYGKNILFTDLKDWTAEEIAKTYNSKAMVEDDFKALKNRLLIPIKPFFHRKDSHLRVHIFICVLSMILYRYMLWKLKDLKMSERKITYQIKAMRLAFVKQKNSSSVKKVLESMSPGQIKIYSILGLDKYLPN